MGRHLSNTNVDSNMNVRSIQYVSDRDRNKWSNQIFYIVNNHKNYSMGKNTLSSYKSSIYEQ